MAAAGLAAVTFTTPLVVDAALRDQMRQDGDHAAETLLAAAELRDTAPFTPLPVTAAGRLLQVRSPEGRIVAATHAAVRLSGDGTDVEVLAGPSASAAVGDDGWVAGSFDPETLVDGWRVSSASTQGAGGTWTAYAATPEGISETSQTVRTVMVILGPGLLLAIGALSWWSVGRALQPVDRVRSQAAVAAAAGRAEPLDVPTNNDELRLLVTTFNDLLARATESVARQRRFVADASHELLTPLSSLRTQLEVAQRYDGTDWPAVASRCTELEARVSEVAERLLTLARLEGAAEPTASAEVDLVAVIEQQMALLGPGVQADVPPRLVVSGDRTALGQLVRNLLANAQHHASSRVGVGAEQEPDGTVIVRVDDDGPGVPAAERRRIFEPFVRLDQARSRKDGGAGLGLAIVAAVAAAHAGTVRCTASPLGGARFEVRLPPTSLSG